MARPSYPQPTAPRSTAVSKTALISSPPIARSRKSLDPHIAAASKVHGVSYDLIRAIIETESQFDPFAVSSRGACGLMQLMPGTARRFGLVDCFDARQNVLAGTRYLKLLLTRYGGSVPLSIAAYNAGEGAVSRHGGIPPYPQTRAYVRKVEALLAAVSDVRSGMPLVTI